MKTKRRKPSKNHIWKKPYKSLHEQFKKHKIASCDCIKLINGVKV